MLNILNDLRSILLLLPTPLSWAFVGAVIATTVVLSLWSFRDRAKAYLLVPVTAAFVIGAAGVLGIKMTGTVEYASASPSIARSSTSLFLRSAIMPHNSYLLGNEVYVYLDSYLDRRTLIASDSEAKKFLHADNRMLGYPGPINNELVFTRVKIAPFKDRIGLDDVARLLRHPHFGVGVPDRNFAIFLLDPAYRRSADVYLFNDGRQYYLVPSALAAPLL